MDDAKPTITVSGLVRVDDPPLSPPSPKVTSITIVGGGFTPGSDVTLKLELPPIRHAATAADDGSVSWDTTIHVRLDDGSVLNAMALYSSDPTNPDAPLLTVRGQGNVEVVVFEHGRAT